MTQCQGTDTGYAGLADTYLALALDESDNIYGTDLLYSTPINYSDFVKKMNAYDGQQREPKLLDMYASRRTAFDRGLQAGIDSKLTDNITEGKTNMFDLISQFDDLSEITKILQRDGWDNYLSTTNYGAFFAPTNNAIKSASNWLSSALKNRSYIRDILRSHTLEFRLRPDEFISRKLEIYTKLPGFSFILDATGQFTPGVNVYQKPHYQLDMVYPIKTERFNLKKIFETDNGFVYIIDGIFSPSISI